LAIDVFSAKVMSSMIRFVYNYIVMVVAPLDAFNIKNCCQKKEIR